MEIISNSKCAAVAGGYVRRIDLLVDAQVVFSLSPINWIIDDPVPDPVAQLNPGLLGTAHPPADVCRYPAVGAAEQV